MMEKGVKVLRQSLKWLRNKNKKTLKLWQILGKWHIVPTTAYIYVEAKNTQNIYHNLEINDWYRRQRCCNKKGVNVSTEGRKQRKKMGNTQGRVAKMLLWANVDLDRKKRPGHWYPEEVFSLLVVELLNQWYNWETLDPCVCVHVWSLVT